MKELIATFLVAVNLIWFISAIFLEVLGSDRFRDKMLMAIDLLLLAVLISQ